MRSECSFCKKYSINAVNVCFFPCPNPVCVCVFCSPGPPLPPQEVQVQCGQTPGVLQVRWKPPPLTSSGTSNGASVIGYAVCTKGQKVQGGILFCLHHRWPLPFPVICIRSALLPSPGGIITSFHLQAKELRRLKKRAVAGSDTFSHMYLLY